MFLVPCRTTLFPISNYPFSFFIRFFPFSLGLSAHRRSRTSFLSIKWERERKSGGPPSLPPNFAHFFSPTFPPPPPLFFSFPFPFHAQPPIFLPEFSRRFIIWGKGGSEAEAVGRSASEIKKNTEHTLFDRETGARHTFSTAVFC